MAELTDVKGVSDSRAEDLREEGFTTVDDVATASTDALAAVNGIGASTADDLIESAQDVIRGDTLSEDDDGDSEQTHASEEEVEEIVEEPTADDLQELVEDGSDEEPPIEDLDVEDDEEEPREVEVESSGPNTVELVVEDAEAYDSLYYAMVALRLGNFYVNGPQIEVANEIIGQLRSADGPTTVELELYQDGFNALVAGLQQVEVSVQGLLHNEAFEALQALREQVEEQR